MLARPRAWRATCSLLMLLPASDRKLANRILESIDASVVALRRVGKGSLGWTFATSAGLAATVLLVYGPSGPFPHPLALERRPMLLLLITSLAVGLTLLGIAAARKRRGEQTSMAELYGDGVRRPALLAAFPLVVVLREPLEEAHSGMVLGLSAAVGALAAYTAYHWASDREPSSRRSIRALALAVVLAATLGYVVIVAGLAFANHQSFNTGRSDLGYYLSIFRQSSQGIPLGCSLCGGGSHLTGHFDPILVVLSPLFLLYPFAETLLLLQTVWLASGALPVYLLGHHHLRHRGAAAALALAYLAYPALHGVNLFDFHSVALCIPLFLWLLYCLERDIRWGYYVSLFALLLVREDIPIELTFVGLYAIFSGARERARLGLITVVVSALYFIMAKAFLMGRVDPLNTATGAAGGYAYYYEAMIPPGHSTGGLIATLVSNPMFVLAQVFTEEKVDYMLKLLVPLLLLPLAARGRVMLAYGSALTLLATRPYLFSIHFQYSSLLIPFLFALCAASLGRIRSGEPAVFGLSGPRLSRALSFGILASTLLCSWKFGGLVANGSFEGGFRPLVREATPEHRATAAWLKQIARSLPRGAKVAANSRIVTHLGAVTHLGLFDSRWTSDYVVASITSRPFGPRILAEEARGELALIASHDNVRVYRTRYTDRTKAKAASEPPEP